MTVEVKKNTKLHLFQALGVELEYMIVDRNTLDIKPITDKLLKTVSGSYVSEVERGEIAWSNELVLHVVELKTNGPAIIPAGLQPLPVLFQDHVNEINRHLSVFDAQLMPTAMHPWMNPWKEMHLWPHEYNPIYEAYNRIFDCRGHGWANLQSTHINLPFNGDDEFGRLHAAIRLVLPLLPALAASSPVADGALTGLADFRLEVYRNNAVKIPSITGLMIPERVYTRAGYDREIFQRMYRDISPFDPDKTLQDEWLNSRGAIARFDRNTIEIRLLDIQECPLADLAIVNLVIDTVKALVTEKWSKFGDQKILDEKDLYPVLMSTVQNAENTKIENPAFLKLFGFNVNSVSAGSLWRHIASELYTNFEQSEHPLHRALKVILNEGTLSTRIQRRFSSTPTKNDLKLIYGELCDCLSKGIQFTAK